VTERAAYYTIIRVHYHAVTMPVILASLIFAISLSLLPYTESQEYESEEEMQRLKAEYLARIRKRTVRKAGMLDRINSACMAEMNGNGSDQNKTLVSQFSQPMVFA
jgi:hypothetical protein